jgi:hypothetical protein
MLTAWPNGSSGRAAQYPSRFATPSGMPKIEPIRKRRRDGAVDLWSLFRSPPGLFDGTEGAKPNVASLNPFVFKGIRCDAFTIPSFHS